MILNPLADALIVSKLRSVASRTKALSLGVPPPAHSVHMIARFRHLFRQHHKRTTLRQFAPRLPGAPVFMPLPATRQRKPSADAREIVIQLLPNVVSDARNMDMQMVL